MQYVSYVDSSDVISGHGTHVCGTIVGNNINDPDDVNRGHAPDAKLAMFDIGDSSGLSLPSPFTPLFDIAANAGAKLHSNSWGAGSNIYDSDVIAMDEYHFVHDQFLALFAAGNSGSYGDYSIQVFFSNLYIPIKQAYAFFIISGLD
jgi:hypothetical protein